jgi:hypothetical protein
MGWLVSLNRYGVWIIIDDGALTSCSQGTFSGPSSRSDDASDEGLSFASSLVCYESVLPWRTDLSTLRSTHTNLSVRCGKGLTAPCRMVVREATRGSTPALFLCRPHSPRDR